MSRRVRNFGLGTPKLNEGIIVSGSAAGDMYSVIVTGSVSFQGDITTAEYIYHREDADTFIRFQDDEINIEAGGRQMLKIQEAATDKVIFNNGGMDVDVQIKGENEANLFRTDAANDRVGIKTASPKSSLSVNGSLALSVLNINSSNDPGTAYTISNTDCVILVNTRPQAQGGIDSAITLTLPDASDNPGMVITVKDAAGYADVNAVTIARAGSDTINGIDTSVALPTPASFKTFISDGASAWQEIGS